MDLYQYQIEAIDKMKNGCILCGGVGSGKSRTALTYFYLKVCKGSITVNGSSYFAKAHNPRNLFIITTAKKRDSHEWENECLPFCFDTSGIKVVIDSWNNIGKYVKEHDSFFIFDEQRVVGKGTWSKDFIKITGRNKWILLSATPGDTWMDYVTVFIANGFYKNRTQFIKRHVIFSRWTKYPKVEMYLDQGYLEKLRSDILITMDYQKKTIRHYENVIVDYDKEMYRTALKMRFNPYKNEPCKQISDLCLVLRRIVNTDPERIEAVKRLILQRKKVIIFYNFDYELDILRKIAKELDILCTEWNGHKHEEVPIGKRWIYLVQYTAGSEGWNCITTDSMIFYSQSYSYKQTEQAAGRIDRVNTPYTDLYYYRIKTASSIDLAIFKALSQKHDFNENAFL